MQPQTHRSFRSVFWTLALVGLSLDISSKYIIFANLRSPEDTWSFELVPGVFRLNTTTNYGALFGIGQGMNLFFLIVSFIAGAGIIWWSTRPAACRRFYFSVSLGLILAGTLGNLYDRIVFGGVRDFLDWYYLYNWPVFNIADCCLVCGATLLAVQALFLSPKPNEVAKPQTAQDSNETEVVQVH